MARNMVVMIKEDDPASREMQFLPPKADGERPIALALGVRNLAGEPRTLTVALDAAGGRRLRWTVPPTHKMQAVGLTWYPAPDGGRYELEGPHVEVRS
jgi:hypothetical protein